MKRVTVPSAVLIVLALTIAPIAQAPSAGGYTAYGEGAASCGVWLKDKANAGGIAQWPYMVDKAWAVGFVSGAGYVSPKRLQRTDSPGIDASMDAYCQAHPLEPIRNGAQAIVDQLTTN